MRIRTSLIVAVAIVVGAASLSLAGERTDTDSLLARLSYRSTWVMQPGQKVSPRICLSVMRDGRYRVLRMNEIGQMELQEGTLPSDQLKHLQTLLDAPEFRALTGSHGGMIRQGSDSFMAEVPREGAVQRVSWMIPDHKKNFPDPAAKVIGWLQSFHPEGDASVVHTDFPDVCPQVGLQPVQPAVAQEMGPSGQGSCNDSGRAGTR